MDEKRLDELERLAGKASPGPWAVPEYDKADPAYSLVCTVEKRLRLELPFIQVVPVTNGDLRDANFIAAMNPAAALDLIRLARLGLWAMRHASPALVRIALEAHKLDHKDGPNGTEWDMREWARSALALQPCVPEMREPHPSVEDSNGT